MAESGKRLAAQKKAEMASKLEATEYYECPACCVHTSARYSFDKAVEAEFRCPDCQGMLQYANQKKF